MKNKNIGLRNGIVSLVQHDKSWKRSFLFERKAINKALVEGIIKIEHVGSTSIKYIKAKPIIDILIVLDINYDTEMATKILTEIGYEKGVFQRKDEVFYLKSFEEIHTHYLHLVHENKDWNRYIQFRDHLNNNIEIARQYEKLKSTLAEKFKDSRKDYTAAKEAFVEKILSTLR